MIRKVQERDLEQLAVLFDKYRLFYEQETDVQTAYHFLKERFDKEESTVFVAETDGNLLGFTQVYPIFSSVQMKPAYLLNDLFVVESARQQGVAAKLIETVFDEAQKKGVAFVTLETGASNLAAQSVYQRMGMVREDKVYHFYKNF